ncbi:TPM domain-containing protein [Bacillus benzoevorans]|uniref:TPM domain-containing protein n=1 Tax=Bacillus benzoevorans TaxID=1456 RepID=A0A7X0HXI5_9BACI|nr:TPM domain-containing protein [Bacillus benzoevorans]MBB6447426.1 uncharacterized protein [Bacillus benzoevorans]
MGTRMIKRSLFILLPFLLLALLPWSVLTQAESMNQKQFIYDNAQLLTKEETTQLELLSSELSKERNTAFVIITLNGTEGKTIVQYMEDFYDEQALGYDQPHGNTALLIMDMQGRDVYLAGFKKAEQYLDSVRLEMIRNQITPDLSEGAYDKAFSSFIETAYDYMGYEPGVNPENIFFKWWFQLVLSITLAGVIVALMAYRSGGRVTVNGSTYIDKKQSAVISEYDQFVRETVTRVKKPSNPSNGGGGGGGGGTTGGGHSYSGSGGKF